MSYWNKLYAIKAQAEKRGLFSDVPKRAGIYIWTRMQNKITYWYIGQAQNLYERRMQYYMIQVGLRFESRPFALSLKKHPDWKFNLLELCDESELDEKEKYYINIYNNKDYYATRNDVYANVDKVAKNTKSSNKKLNKYKSNIKTLLNRLDVFFKDGKMTISAKTNKNGEFNKVSKQAYNEIIKEYEDVLRH